MDRKNYSIFKIIIWSIIVIFLMSVLVSGIKFNSIDLFKFNFGNIHNFDSSEYLSGNSEVDASDITDIEINWIDGSVNIDVYDGNTIKFYEECKNELSDSDLLHYYSKSNKLKIEYSGTKKIPIFIGGSNLKKSLTVQIPESMLVQFNDLNIEAVSSNVNISNINSKYIDIENISGNILLNNIAVDKIDIDTTSGDIDSDNIIIKKSSNIDTISGSAILNGSISAIEFDSTSGDLKVVSDICPNEADTDTTSGNISLSIPDNSGFSYSFDGVSGKMKCDFPSSGESDEGKYGDGTSDFSFDTISGDVYISQNNL